jgi:hypothetical protein
MMPNRPNRMKQMDANPGNRWVIRTSGDRGFVTRHIAGETLIIPVAGRVGDLDAIYTLNEVGSRIWDLIERPTTVVRIADVLSREFDVSSEEATRDVLEFLDLLEARRLVEAVGLER